jgi:TPP-dependent pyruvate/acetoin dehydrogenase alpha subunit
MNNPTERDQVFYRQMLRIRLFEERTLTEFSRGRLFGTTHTYIGQEANAVGLLAAARRSDVVFSNHRGHGHYLAHGGDMTALAAELMGKATGVCGGRGGSQHLHFGSFYSNGIQGGIVPCATGMALAEKQLGSDNIVIVFLGDGTLGEGVVYESLNIASLWGLPVLYVVENNRYAQTTPVQLALAGNMVRRFESFAISTCELDTTDVYRLNQVGQEVIDEVRASQKPKALIIHTYRFSAHSKGDDIRNPEEVEQFRRFDPLLVQGRRLTNQAIAALQVACEAEVEQAFMRAELAPWPEVRTGLGAALEVFN